MARNIIIVLDNIRSLLNVGAILRTADGSGVYKVYLCGITPTLENKKLTKTALGAEEFVNTKYFKNTIDAVNEANASGYQIISVEQTPKALEYTKVKFSDKVCLIFGNELTGVSSDVIEKSDICIELPMLGKKNSLNVATTVGIVTYHIRFVA